MLGAVFAGAAASVAWCLAGYFTGYDLPAFSALIVGGIVGFGAVSLDGHGVPMAFFCAFVSIISVLGGKAGAVYVAMVEAREQLAASLTEERYAAMKVHAPALGALPSSDYYKDFMVENGYTQGDEVSGEDLERFEAVEVPVMRRLVAEGLSIGTWRKFYVEKYLDYTVSNHTVVGIVISELGLVDLFFGALGVAITFAMVVSAGETRRNVSRMTRVG
jgi:hypothetical protein